MSANTRRDPPDVEAVIDGAEAEAARWSRSVDTLLQAFGGLDEVPPALGSKLEALRNKRDTVVTKVEALKRHRGDGLARARRELERARRELRDAWRTVIGILQKESLFP